MRPDWPNTGVSPPTRAFSFARPLSGPGRDTSYTISVYKAEQHELKAKGGGHHLRCPPPC